jgi:hypothetical protein
MENLYDKSLKKYLERLRRTACTFLVYMKIPRKEKDVLDAGVSDIIQRGKGGKGG